MKAVTLLMAVVCAASIITPASAQVVIERSVIKANPMTIQAESLLGSRLVMPGSKTVITEPRILSFPAVIQEFPQPFTYKPGVHLHGRYGM